MAFYNNVIAGASGSSGGAADYSIQKSLRFDSAGSSYLTRTPGVVGNQKTWTWSGWVKRGAINNQWQGLFTAEHPNNSARNDGIWFAQSGSGTKAEQIYISLGDPSNAQYVNQFRDASAWVHIVVAVDTSQSVEADRLKVYANGIELEKETGSYPTQDDKGGINNTTAHSIGRRDSSNSQFLDGYLADVHFIDGLQLAPTAFGAFNETTGVWDPIEYTGSYSGAQVGTIYSNDLTSSTGAFKTAGPASNAFDGFDTSGTRAQVEPSNSDNYIEFAPSTPISFTNGVYVKCYAANGYNITNYYSVDLTGNGLGSETTFVGGGSNFNDVAWIQVATGSGTLYKVRIRCTRGGGDQTSAGITAIGINGTASGNWLVDGTPAGVNGFHLNFSDATSALTLGYDQRDGVTHNPTGSIYGLLEGGSASNVLDGSTTTYANIRPYSSLTGQGSGVTLDTPITASSSVRIYGSSENVAATRYEINGTDYNSPPTYPNHAWTTITGLSFPITINSFGIDGGSSGNGANIYAIEVDGTVVKGTANDWTPNNIVGSVPPPSSSFTWSGSLLSGTGGSGNPGGYSGSYFQVPAGTSSWDMHMETDSNTGWWFSDSTSQDTTHPNQQSGNFVGHRNGNNTAATGGSGFGSGSPSMPSDSMDGDPRWYWTVNRTTGSGTVKVGPTGTEYSFTVPTTGNVYFHVNAYGAYNYNLGSSTPLTGADSVLDTPTSYESDAGVIGGNYCVINPVDSSSTSTTTEAGNLVTTINNGSSIRGSFYVSSGKWYYEVTVNTLQNLYLGLAGNGGAPTNYSSADAFGVNNAGDIYVNNSNTGLNSVTLVAGSTFGIAFDADAKKWWIAKDGQWYSGDAAAARTINVSEVVAGTSGYDFSSLTGDRFAPHFGNSSNAGAKVTVNFGQYGSFQHTPPTGFKVLCTQNLADPDIVDGSSAFDAKTYPGTGFADLASTSINTSTAYRHHRILFEGDNNGGSVSEIQFFDASGLIDASDPNNSGGSISSNKNQGLDAYTAFNGTLGGSSYSYGVRKDPSTGFYIAKDWGSGNEKTITSVKIWGVDSYAIAGNTAGKYVKLQGSSDGTNWTDLQTWDDSRTGSWTTSSSTEPAHISDTAKKISGLNFSPDFVWTKSRDASYRHMLFDTIRGVGKNLTTNLTNAETTNDSYGYISAFNDDGWDITAGSNSGENFNQLTKNYVAWAWDGGDFAPALDTNTYDQSQTWSTGMKTSTSATNTYSTTGRTTSFPQGTNGTPFNGDLTDYLYSTTGVQGTWWFLEFATALTNVTSIQFNTEYSCPGGVIKLNGTDVAVDQSDIGSGYVTVSVTGTIPSSLTEIAVQGYSGSARLKWVKINGKYLLDPGVILAGGLNSSIYLQGDIYSGDFSTNDVLSNVTNAFDGSVSTRAQTANSGNNKTLTWAPSPAVSFSNKFEIYCDQGSDVPTATWNSNSVSPGGGKWVTVYTGSGTIDSTTPLVINTNSASQYATLKAVRLDGKILVDSNVTLADVPSIPTRVRKNTTAGISIATATMPASGNPTIAHNLGAKPDFIIFKSRTSSEAWYISHKGLDNQSSKFLRFDTVEQITNTNWFNNTEPDSQVLTLRVGGAVSAGTDVIIYSFREIEGFSAFGTYQGNGATNNIGPFVALSFSPRWVMIKNITINSSSYTSWFIQDSARNPTNVMPNDQVLWANRPAAEGVRGDGSSNSTYNDIDFLSNGFKIREDSTHELNDGNSTYVWAAFADHPYKYARAK